MKSSNEIYRKLILLMVHSKRHMFEAIDAYNLTPVQGTMLMLFEPDEGKSMQQLSALMGCDASNTTGLVDRLDSQGLIKRTADPADRRVKLITLSEKGRTCRDAVLKGLQEAEATDLKRLTADEQEMLVRVIDKLTLDVDKH